MSTSTEALLAEIEAFLNAHDMAPTNFGLEAVNDGHLVRDLRNGKDVTLSRADKIRAFIASYKKRKGGPPHPPRRAERPAA